MIYGVARELLTNVARHAEATTVWLTLRDDGDAVTLDVRDDGVGIDPAVISRRVAEGTSAWPHSAPGRDHGRQLGIRAGRPGNVGAGHGAGPSREGGAMGISNRKVRVVVGDDHPIYRDGIVAALNRSEQTEVVTAVADGQAALAAIVEHAPDVALLDYKMPGLDGIAVAHAVTRDGLSTRCCCCRRPPRARWCTRPSRTAPLAICPGLRPRRDRQRRGGLRPRREGAAARPGDQPRHPGAPARPDPRPAAQRAGAPDPANDRRRQDRSRHGQGTVPLPRRRSRPTSAASTRTRRLRPRRGRRLRDAQQPVE